MNLDKKTVVVLVLFLIALIAIVYFTTQKIQTNPGINENKNQMETIALAIKYLGLSE